ncbi:MAG: DUF3179 domain-containing protein [Chromatiaceae bacterium]|nr:DUF3179 domain-containing protein [Chromatiaceae bacterium]MCF7996697.1 DUF3179 domain-containing protein [Chromatiaceae bacterium]
MTQRLCSCSARPALVVVGLVALSANLLLDAAPTAQQLNGFAVHNSLVPVAEIHAGGPDRDGIPAIDQPRFVEAEAVDFLARDDEVLGLVHQGEARAYPIKIMDWHEIVNDRIEGEPIAITYCPLCGSGIAFRAEQAGRELSFGVSGLLYNSDLLLYDRQTESLWSQIAKQAIAGPLAGTKLTALPLTHTTWGAWRRAHPQTQVLSTETGHRRNYDRAPYGGYSSHGELYFPVSARSKRYHPKERVLGVEVNGQFKAYPFAELSQTDGRVSDQLGGESIEVRFDWAQPSARAFDAEGDPLPTTTLFWFAWYAFHPETEVYRAN